MRYAVATLLGGPEAEVNSALHQALADSGFQISRYTVVSDEGRDREPSLGSITNLSHDCQERLAQHGVTHLSDFARVEYMAVWRWLRHGEEPETRAFKEVCDLLIHAKLQFADLDPADFDCREHHGWLRYGLTRGLSNLLQRNSILGTQILRELTPGELGDIRHMGTKRIEILVALQQRLNKASS